MAALLYFGFLPAAQGQVTLDFENLSNPTGNALNFQGFSVSQNGFTLTDTSNAFGLVSVAPGSSGTLNYTRSVALLNDMAGGVTTITQDNGSAFTLNSIDIANLVQQSSRPSGVKVVFSGKLFGGGTVTKTFTHGANDSLETVTFGSAFTNLVSVSLDQTYPYNHFDNIVLNGPVIAPTTPEPGSIALLVGFGVACAGFLRKRR